MKQKIRETTIWEICTDMKWKNCTEYTKNKVKNGLAYDLLF